jgi:hypothetical protein
VLVAELSGGSAAWRGLLAAGGVASAGLGWCPSRSAGRRRGCMRRFGWLVSGPSVRVAGERAVGFPAGSPWPGCALTLVRGGCRLLAWSRAWVSWWPRWAVIWPGWVMSRMLLCVLVAMREGRRARWCWWWCLAGQCGGCRLGAGHAAGIAGCGWPAAGAGGGGGLGRRCGGGVEVRDEEDHATRYGAWPGPRPPIFGIGPLAGNGGFFAALGCAVVPDSWPGGCRGADLMGVATAGGGGLRGAAGAGAHRLRVVSGAAVDCAPVLGGYAVAASFISRAGAVLAGHYARWGHALEVTGGGGLAGHAGAVLVRKLAGRAGLTAGLGPALARAGGSRWRTWVWRWCSWRLAAATPAGFLWLAVAGKLPVGWLAGYRPGRRADHRAPGEIRCRGRGQGVRWLSSAGPWLGGRGSW